MRKTLLGISRSHTIEKVSDDRISARKNQQAYKKMNNEQELPNTTPKRLQGTSTTLTYISPFENEKIK